MIPDNQIEQYLLSFRRCLAPMTIEEREDILREITAHIQDSMAESGEPAAAVLARLGAPEELATQYSDGLLVRRASRSFSPLLLLRAALRVGTKGFFGMLVFVCGLFGYCLGVGFVLTALLKLFLPANTGVWVANGHFVSSGSLYPPPQAPAHEVLGWWYFPIALVMGTVLCVVTTFAIRAFLRLSRRWQKSLAVHSSAAIPQSV
jgi:uncharacterized membrane protein